MGKACAHAGAIWTLRTNAARQPRTPHHGTSDMIRQRRLEGPRGCCALGAPPHACNISCVHHSLSLESEAVIHHAGGEGGLSCRTPSIDGSPIWSTRPVASGTPTWCGGGRR